jgi:hypothetical protein
MRVVASNKNRWTKADTELLIETVKSDMKKYGVIDPVEIGDHFDRSPTSIKWKLDSIGVKYRIKIGTAPPVFETLRQQNTREMPLHTKGDLAGKPVHYSRYYDNKPTRGKVYEAYRNSGRKNSGSH